MSKKTCGPQPLLYPMPAVLVGVTIEGKANFMTVAWCGITAYKPPSLMIGINKERYTLRGIKPNGAFSVNVASVEQVKMVDYCGIYSGAKKDKSRVFKIFHGMLKEAPLIEECPVNLECHVKHIVDMESHIVVLGEIMETHVSESCLTNGKADTKKIDPLIFSYPDGQYWRMGEAIGRAFQLGKEK
jgi:flavin reductase (DIM6/NTAB) family NADH-FMN oxidoreductase RutF